MGPTTEAIIQYWKDNLGVTVQIQQAESGTFFDDIDEGRYQMFHLGWIMDYPDPEDVLDLLFYSKSKQNSKRLQILNCQKSLFQKPQARLTSLCLFRQQMKLQKSKLSNCQKNRLLKQHLLQTRKSRQRPTLPQLLRRKNMWKLIMKLQPRKLQSKKQKKVKHFVHQRARPPRE